MHDTDPQAWPALAQQLELQRTSSMIANDLDLLGELFSQDLVYTHANAHSDSRTSLLEKMRNNVLDYHRIDARTDHVTPFGDGFLIDGLAEIDVTVGGVFRKLTMRFIVAWRREQGVWRFVAHQATTLPSKESPTPAA